MTKSKQKCIQKVPRAWKKCEVCSVQTKNIRHYKGDFLCFKCFRKKANIINSKYCLTLEEAKNKVYTINGKKYDYGVSCYCSFPSVLLGKKFKLKLVDEDEKRKQSRI